MNKSNIIHSDIWGRLSANPDSFPHALLLAGPAGIGKGLFAADLAMGLLCESRSSDFTPCGQCQSCHWFASQSHPDFRKIVPESDLDGEEEKSEATERKRASSQIKIGQIRELEDFVYVGSHRERGRVVIIEPAEAMNLAAANSLLKLLEEPPATVYFILVSSRWRRLLPTILSRCRMIQFPRPRLREGAVWLAETGHQAAAEFLAFAGGAPLMAIAEAERGGAIRKLLDSLVSPGDDPLALAGRWETQVARDNELSLEDIVTTLQKWLSDLTLLKLGGAMRFAAERREAAVRLVEKAPARNLIRCYNDFSRIRALASHPLNPRLFLEESAERYLRALAAARP